MIPPVPTLEQWVQKVENDLKGRGYPSLFWQTLDGFAVPPLITRAEASALPHLAATALLRQRRGFAIRELVTVAAPERANARARRALGRGAAEVEFALDVAAQDALEPLAAARADDDAEDLLGQSLPGDGGVAIHARPDLDAALDGIDLATTPLWFSAGEGALPVLAWWLRRADAMGVRRDRLRGGLDVDPIARLTCRRLGFVGDDAVGSQRAAHEPVFGEAIAALRTCLAHCPEVRPLVVDGQAFHLAGAPPAVELGATLAAAIDVARRLGERGVTFDDFARASSVRVQVGHELLAEIAKLRALRLLWAKLAAAFGAAGDACVPRVLAVTSGRFRAEEYDQRTNLIRTTLAALASVVGGADSVIVTPWTEAAHDDAAADLARDQLHLLREEARLDRSADPVGGSYAIEKLTDEIGRGAWQLVQQLERAGGFVQAARDGLLAERLSGAEDARETAFGRRRRVLVGISRFADPELGGPMATDAADDSDPGEALLARHERWLGQRDASRAAAIVERIGAHAADRFFDDALADDADHASLAELATATWPPDGVVFEHRFAPVAATDGHAFEELRARADFAREELGQAPRIAVLPFGPPEHARARAAFARDLFVVGGFEVEVLEPATDVSGVAIDRADVLVLCSDDASYPAAVDALTARIATSGPLLIVAGHVDDAVGSRIHGAIRADMDAAAFLGALQDALGIAE